MTLADADFLERTEGRIAPCTKYFARPLLGHVSAGIFKGDLPVVGHNSPTKPGDIVAAFTANELTGKTLRLDAAGKYFLAATTPAYKPVHTSNSLEQMGVVVRRIRK